MGGTKTVSLRVPEEDLKALEAAGVPATEVMRDALRAKAAALRAEAWARECEERMWKPPKGAPRSEDLVRESRDER